jgi:hypothetical protein
MYINLLYVCYLLVFFLVVAAFSVLAGASYIEYSLINRVRVRVSILLCVMYKIYT